MASLVKKKIGGKVYYYARECKRVDGRPKIVWQKYLGKAEDIVRCMTDAGVPAPVQPQQALIAEFGAVAALYDLAERLQIAATIDRHVPKSGAGPGVGTYLLVAILNRCVAPCSKSGMADWFEKTALRRWVNVKARQLSSQRFWDNMDRVSGEAIGKIEQEITARLVREFQIDLRQVLFDGTNFFTFIDTFNERATVPQRGKSKEGRQSLRIVGVALLVAADFGVPLFHHTYAGNQPDSTTFSSVIPDLVARFRAVSQGVEHVTIVFDKGNNSQDNLQAVEETPYHFVGSLVPTQHEDLLKIPKRRFRSLEEEGLPGVTAYRTSKKVYGAERTIVVTHNDNLFVAQTGTLLREIGKRQRRLQELQRSLRAWRRRKDRRGKPPTVSAAQKKVTGWLKARHMKELFHVDIREQDGLPMLKYRFDHAAWERLQRRLLGKTLLFTDNHEWSNAHIVKAYRSQHHVEAAFRDMKDPRHLSLRPQFHWTDQKIEVHVFCCVLAYMLCALLRRQLHTKGIDRSIGAILNDLSQIREVGVIFRPHGKRKPTIKTMLSALSDDQRALYETLRLERYQNT
jgi:transposase